MLQSKTARSSVMLIFSPLNMASIRERKPDSSARHTRSLRVSSVMRFFECAIWQCSGLGPDAHHPTTGAATGGDR